MEITLLDRIANRLFLAYITTDDEWFWDGLMLVEGLADEQIETD